MTYKKALEPSSPSKSKNSLSYMTEFKFWGATGYFSEISEYAYVKFFFRQNIHFWIFGLLFRTCWPKRKIPLEPWIWDPTAATNPGLGHSIVSYRGYWSFMDPLQPKLENHLHDGIVWVDPVDSSTPMVFEKDHVTVTVFEENHIDAKDIHHWV